MRIEYCKDCGTQKGRKYTDGGATVMICSKCDDCVFCSMSFPDTEVLNIEPLNPVTKGHRIFIPKDHVRDFSENADVTIKTMYAAQQYAKEVGGDFNIITSAGKSATQSVFHLHVHFVPRTENDGLHLPWTNQVKVVEQY